MKAPFREKKVIKCASSSLTPSHPRYASKLECIAVPLRNRTYLRGLLYFEIWTDPEPLVIIFEKGLNDLDNPRLK